MRNKAVSWLGGLGLGALLVYIFDPNVGRRRRAVVRDKATRFGRKTLDAFDVTSRDIKNRVTGLTARTKNLIKRDGVSDEILMQRLRSELGGLVSHPGSVDVRAENGKVILGGSILASEVDGLLRRLSSMREAKSIDNRLEVHNSAGSIPGLQGQPPQRKGGEAFDIAQSNWSPSTRFLTGTFAAGIALYGARKLNVFGTAVAGLGTAVVTRALSNTGFKRMIGIGTGRNAIAVHKIINVAAPVPVVFDFWSKYENFPLVMSNVRDVKNTGENLSHWVVAGPAGTPVEWDAVVANYVPNKAIAWETTPESLVQHSGIVRFEATEDGSTRVDIKMSYNPVAGALGHAAAALFGTDPRSLMDQDLARMKTMIETGRPPDDAARKNQPAYIH